MAEKEERIFIGFINPEGDACPVPYGKCNSLCDNCKGGMTRQELINRIAKAICANEDEYTDCKQCGFNGPEDCKRYCRNNWLYTAEAVLNALLEGK